MLEKKLVRHGMLSKFNVFLRRLKPFDRRQDKRFIPVRPIECVYTKAGQQEKFSAVIINISNGGILIATEEDKIHPRTEVEMRFQLPDRQDVISIHGKVMRTYRWKEASWYYSGVKFLNKKEAGIKSLLDFAS